MIVINELNRLKRSSTQFSTDINECLKNALITQRKVEENWQGQGAQSFMQAYRYMIQKQKNTETSAKTVIRLVQRLENEVRRAKQDKQRKQAQK